MATQHDEQSPGVSGEQSGLKQKAEFIGDSLEILSVPATLVLVVVLAGWRPTDAIGVGVLIGAPVVVAIVMNAIVAELY